MPPPFVPNNLAYLNADKLPAHLFDQQQRPKISGDIKGYPIVAFKGPTKAQGALANTVAFIDSNNQPILITMSRPDGSPKYAQGLPTSEHWYHLGKFDVLRGIANTLPEDNDDNKQKKRNALAAINGAENAYITLFNGKEVNPKAVDEQVTTPLFATLNGIIRNDSFKTQFDQKWKTKDQSLEWMRECIIAKANTIPAFRDYLIACAKHGIMPVEASQHDKFFATGPDGMASNMLGILLLQAGNAMLKAKEPSANLAIPNPAEYFTQHISANKANAPLLAHNVLLDQTKDDLKTMPANNHLLNDVNRQANPPAPPAQAAPKKNYQLPANVSFATDSVCNWLLSPEVKDNEDAIDALINETNHYIEAPEHKITDVKITVANRCHKVALTTADNKKHDVHLWKDAVNQKDMLSAEDKDMVPEVFAFMAVSVKQSILAQAAEVARQQGKPAPTEVPAIIPIITKGLDQNDEDKLFASAKALIHNGLIPEFPADKEGLITKFVDQLTENEKIVLDKTYKLFPAEHNDKLKEALAANPVVENQQITFSEPQQQGRRLG